MRLAVAVLLVLPGCFSGGPNGCDPNALAGSNGWAPPFLVGEDASVAEHIATGLGDTVTGALGPWDGPVDHLDGTRWQTAQGELLLRDGATGAYAVYEGAAFDDMSAAGARDVARRLGAPGFGPDHGPNMADERMILWLQEARPQGFDPGESVELSATSFIRITPQVTGDGVMAIITGLSDARLEAGMLDRQTVTRLAFAYDACVLRAAGHDRIQRMPAPEHVDSQHIPLGVFDGSVVRVVTVLYEAAEDDVQACASNGNAIAVDALTGRIHGSLDRWCPELVHGPTRAGGA